MLDENRPYKPPESEVLKSVGVLRVRKFNAYALCIVGIIFLVVTLVSLMGYIMSFNERLSDPNYSYVFLAAKSIPILIYAFIGTKAFKSGRRILADK